VAIKVLQESWVGDAEFRRRLRAEADVMRSLEHPNCVRVYEVIDTPQVAALVTEYVDGATLKQVLTRAGRLSGPQAAKVLSGALRGLAHVHGRGLIHGDVKPANICVDRSGTSRLLDFGLARPPAAGGEIAGSPAYMSPEQITGGELDERSDIYSCGVVLYELLTGERPFQAVDPDEVLAAHLSAPVPDPAATYTGVPRQLAAVAVTALAKQPSARPPTADRFRELLEQAAEREYGLVWATVSLTGLAALGDSSTGAGNLSPPEEAMPRRTRRRPPARSAASATALVVSRPRRSARRRVLAVVAAGAALVAILGTAIGVHRRHPPAPKVPLASCLVGTWGWAGGSFEDVWDGTPVRVQYPPSARPETIRYQADGRYTDSYAAATPPATGALHGAVFIHQTYGTDAGRWRVIGTDRIARTDIGSGATTILYAGYQHASSPGFALQSGAVPLSLRCNQASMTVIDNFTYHGRLLTSATTYHRQVGGQPGSRAIPDASGVLGGVDVDAYCQQVMHGQRAALVKPLTGQGAATGNWACALGGAVQPLSYADACQWAYADHLAVTARAVDPNAAYSWLCFGGPLRRLRITPGAGGVGTSITVSSIDPCPAGTRALTVQLVQAPAQDGIQTGGDRPLAGGGAWRFQLSVGPFGGTAPRIPPGTATVQAYCLLTGNRYVGYQPAPFHFTGHP
jgi:Serine/threonine protein kinase